MEKIIIRFRYVVGDYSKNKYACHSYSSIDDPCIRGEQPLDMVLGD